jgi:hypothetical protein
LVGLLAQEAFTITGMDATHVVRRGLDWKDAEVPEVSHASSSLVQCRDRAGWAGLSPGTANPLSMLVVSSNVSTLVEKVGYWRRQYRRYGYPAPYAYYPPVYGYAYPPAVYGYQPAPPAYAYSPPGYGGEAPPPAADPSGEEDYGDYPPADGDYPAAEGEYGDYPANGS